MGGKLYFGSQKVTPAIVVSSGPAEPVIDSLTITPSTSQQTITASGGVDGYSPITVNAVTSSIDANITVGNIVDGVTILGVTGTATELNADTLNVTPSTSAQTITPTSPKNGFDEVNVSAVTSSIDANIQAENIKNGVTILGVTGSYQGGGGSTKYCVGIDSLLGDVDANGVLQMPADTTGDIIFTGVKDVSDYGLYNKFYYESNLSHAVSFPDLTTISGSSGCSNMFVASHITSISFPNLTTVSGYGACSGMCTSCNYLTSVSLPELTTISGSSGCNNMFGSCVNVSSVSIPKLKTISGSSGCSNMFSSCRELSTITFNLLDTITGSNSMSYCFSGCYKLSSVSFPSLKTSSFGSSYSNQFSNMFNSSTAQTSGACTVHFPSNLQSTISGLTGYPTFGGNASRITLAFDLTATS